ncbi:hypothetical protein Agub_g8140, partial [Astrephomene gubernaculifera]
MVPLMRERHSEERLCVNCKTTFVIDGQGLRPTSAPSPPAAAPGKPPAQPPAAQEDTTRLHAAPAAAEAAAAEEEESREGVMEDAGEGEGEDGEVPYDPLADPRLGPFAASTEKAAAAAPAGGTVSVADGDGGKDAGGGGGGGDSSAKRCRLDLPAGGQQQQQQPGPTPAAAAAPSTSPSRPDVAELLSTKMLQGWALLDKYCPRCSTVLVRSRATRRMFCVACDAWVLQEG